ncbi:hypothetical protein ACFLU3_06125 [Chloroflexota bacterium]
MDWQKQECYVCAQHSSSLSVQRELRAERSKLQRAKDEAIADLEDDKPQQLDVDQVLRYVMDLKDLLLLGLVMQQRIFLRSFI